MLKDPFLITGKNPIQKVLLKLMRKQAIMRNNQDIIGESLETGGGKTFFNH